MKITLSILFLFVFTVSKVYCQSSQQMVKAHDSYRKHVDSVYNVWDSLHHALDDSSAALLSRGESIGEGVYEEIVNGQKKTLGGFEVRAFFAPKGDSIYRIQFSGGKRDAYVIQSYYYQNNHLVLAELTLRPWKSPEAKTPYTIREYYKENLMIFHIIQNSPAPKVDHSLIPKSLHKEGDRLFNLEKTG